MSRDPASLADVPSGALPKGPTPATAPHEPDGEPLVDLRTLWRAVPRAIEQDGVLYPRRRVSAVDGGVRPVLADPLDVTCVLDGIQMSLLLTRRSRRPITIAYTAAGAVDPRLPQGRALEEHLSFICSWLDEDYVRALPGHVPEVVLLDEQDPAEVEAAAQATVRSQRAQAEANIANALPLAESDSLVVDGSIAHLPPRSSGNVLGLVKTCTAQWLSDEDSDIPVAAEQRSGTFLIHGRRRGDYDRFSCYVRLHSAPPEAPWSLGLVRLEAHQPELLDGFARYVLNQRQGPGRGDPRWRRHAASVRHVEQMLRARAPVAFECR